MKFPFNLFQVDFLGLFESFIHSSDVGSNLEEMSPITADFLRRLLSDSDRVLNLGEDEQKKLDDPLSFVPEQSSLSECRASQQNIVEPRGVSPVPMPCWQLVSTSNS